MFNFPKNMSDAKIKRRLRACQFCRDIFINLDKAGLSLYHKVNLNCNSAGIVISKVYLTEETQCLVSIPYGANRHPHHHNRQG